MGDHNWPRATSRGVAVLRNANAPMLTPGGGSGYGYVQFADGQHATNYTTGAVAARLWCWSSQALSVWHDEANCCAFRAPPLGSQHQIAIAMTAITDNHATP